MYLNGHGIHVILYRWPMAMAYRSYDIDSHYIYIYVILYRRSLYTDYTI